MAEQINHSECKEVEDGAANKDKEEARQSDAEEDVKDIEEYLEKYAVHEFQLDRKDEECTEKVKSIKQITKITIVEVSYLCEKEFHNFEDDLFTRVWL